MQVPMNNFQYARVGNVRRKSSYDQTSNVKGSTPGSSDAFEVQEAALNNNLQNNISCK